MMKIIWALIFMSFSAFAQKEGDLLVNTANQLGRVMAIVDGKVLYKLASSNDLASDDLQLVAFEVAQKNDLKVGLRTADSSLSLGKITKVFSNGKIQYKNDNSSYLNIAPHIFAYEVPEKNGFRAGMKAVDENLFVGTIHKVFSNGMYEFQKDGFNFSFVAPHLSLETETHPKYLKNVEYANSQFRVGPVLRFFENGDVQLDTTPRSIASRELAEEVEDYQGLHHQSEMLTPSAGVIFIDKVFANGVAKAYFHNHVLSLRILSQKDLQDEKLRQSWLEDMLKNENHFATSKNLQHELHKLLLSDVKNDKTLKTKDRILLIKKFSNK